MVASVAYRPRPIPSFPTDSPKAMIRFRVLREGEVTSSPKTIYVFKSWDTLSQTDLAFSTEDGGEFTFYREVDLATLLSMEWLVSGKDDTPPRKARTYYTPLSGSGTITFNISSGEGGGDAGSPAVIPARVRVDGLLAQREVVLLERPIDGEWRMAGYGPTTGGGGSIDARLTGGSLYAIGLDDWGTVFTADLVVTVDQTIRPSVFAGWLYRITEAGTLPAAEPEWWPAEGDNASRLLGTARAIAVRYYQPLAHGPLPVELL